MAQIITEKQLPGGQVLSLRMGDLTDEAVAAIVNAANERLQHGGGVAGAIVAKGGPEIQIASDAIAFVPTGHCTVTVAGRLPCRCVIHAVGPYGSDKDADWLLREATLNSLCLAEALALESIAFPAISSGIFGFPKARCAEIMVRTCILFALKRPRSRLREIRFTLIDRPTVDIFQKFIDSLDTEDPL